MEKIKVEREFYYYLKSLLIFLRDYEIMVTKDLLTEEILQYIKSLFTSKEFNTILKLLSSYSPEFTFTYAENKSIEELMSELKVQSNNLKKEYLEETVNFAYTDLYQDLSQKEPFFSKNLKNLEGYCSGSFLGSLFTLASTGFKEQSKITKDDLIKLITEFLSYLDSTGKITDLFLTEYNKGTIILWDKSTEKPPKKVTNNFAIDADDWACVFMEDDYAFIKGACSGNLDDAFSLIHEFFHYYFLRNKNLPALEEFPSIFFEQLLGKFLIEEKGYDKQEVNSAIKFRLDSHISNSLILADVIEILQKKENGKTLTKEDFIKKVNLDKIDTDFFSTPTYELLLDVVNQCNKEAEEQAFLTMENQMLDLDITSFISFFKYMLGNDLTVHLLSSDYSIEELAHKVLSIRDSLLYSNMSMHYYFSYLEDFKHFYQFNDVDCSKITYPSRLEDKQLKLLQK